MNMKWFVFVVGCGTTKEVVAVWSSELADAEVAAAAAFRGNHPQARRFRVDFQFWTRLDRSIEKFAREFEAAA